MSPSSLKGAVISRGEVGRVIGDSRALSAPWRLQGSQLFPRTQAVFLHPPPNYQNDRGDRNQGMAGCPRGAVWGRRAIPQAFFPCSFGTLQDLQEQLLSTHPGSLSFSVLGHFLTQLVCGVIRKPALTG